MFTSEKLKAIVLPRAESAIGRPVAINDISLSSSPPLRSTSTALTIANRKGEGFSSGPFLTLDALRLNVKLLPLLKSRIEVTTLELDRPRILLEVNRRNETNYADLSGGGTAPPPAAGGAGSPGVPRPAQEPPGGKSAKVHGLRAPREIPGISSPRLGAGGKPRPGSFGGVGIVHDLEPSH